MSKEKTFLLCLLRITDTIIDSFQKDPRKVKEKASIIPDKYQHVPAQNVAVGMTVYQLRDHPRFEGVVHNVVRDDEGLLIEFLDGHTRWIDKDAHVYTCLDRKSFTVALPD